MKRHDYSTLLIWAALLVTVTRYAGAFIASDIGRIDGWVSNVFAVLMGFTGLGMGVLDVLGSAYVFDGWRRIMPRSGQSWPARFKVLTGFIAGMFICGVGILVPFTVSRVQGVGMADVLIGASIWLWAVLVNVAPYLLIGGVVVGQSGVVMVREEATNMQPVAQPVAPELPQPPTMSKRERILELRQAQPDATKTQLAQQVGVSRQYVDKVISIAEKR